MSRVFQTSAGAKYVATGDRFTVASGHTTWFVRMGERDALLVELPSELRWNELRARELPIQGNAHVLTARDIGMLAPEEGSGVMPYRGSAQPTQAYAVWDARPVRSLSHALTQARAGVAIDPRALLKLAYECAHGLAATEDLGLLTPASVLVDASGHASVRGPMLEALTENEAPRWLGYRAPELLRPGASPTAAARSFALGVMLFELLVGRALFDKSGPTAASQLARWNVSLAIMGEIGDVVHAELRAIVWSLLQREPDRRAGASIIVERLAPHYDRATEAAILSPDPSLTAMFAR